MSSTPTSATPLSRHAGAALALLGLVLLLFHRAVFGGGTFFERDVYLYWHAQAEAIVRSVLAGSWPLWDPLASFGEPVWEVPAPNAVAYPTTWLVPLLPPWTFYTFNAVLHALFGGLGVYLLALRLGASRGAALVGGALWIASGPQLSTVNMLNLLNGAAWMPWTLLATEAALRTRRAAPAVLWGACLAAQITAGSETGLMVGPLTAVWTVVAFLQAGDERWKVVRTAAVALVFALGLSAATWMPFGALAQRSARRALPEVERTYWSMAPVGALQTVLPVFPRQLPLRGDAHPALPEMIAPYLYSIYFGIPVVVLAAAGFGSSRRRTAWALGGVVALAVVFALGRHSFLYSVIVTLVPPLRSVRFPVKSMLLVALAVPLLAALGCDAWRERRRGALWAAAGAAAALGLIALLAWNAVAPTLGPLLAPGAPPEVLGALERRLLVAAALAAGLCALALLGRRPQLSAAVALAVGAVAVADLVVSQRTLNPTAPTELLRYRPETAEAIERDGGWRVFFRETAQPRGVAGGRAPGLPLDVAVAFTTKLYLTPPAARLQGIRSSYVRDVKGVHPPWLVELYRLFESTRGTEARLQLLRLGAVSHTVYLDPSDASGLVPLTTVETLFGDPVYVYRVPDPLPLRYLVGGVKVAGGEDALQALLAPDFDPTREVLLEEGTPRPAPADFRGSLRSVEEAPDRLVLEARLDAPGHLVLVESFDRYWRAEVDSEPAPVLRGNVAFRAIPLPAGEHRVELRYRPPAVLVGAVATLASLLLGIAILVRSRPASPAPPPSD